MIRGVALLGSTGSIGTTALRVLDRQRHRFRVAALTAFANTELLAEQALHFAPSFVGVVNNGGAGGQREVAAQLTPRRRRSPSPAYA